MNNNISTDGWQRSPFNVSILKHYAHVYIYYIPIISMYLIYMISYLFSY